MPTHFTMTSANPFGVSPPLVTPMPIHVPWISTSQRHGSAEPEYGGNMGLTPPRTPRSSSRRPSRSRDRDGRRSPRRGDDYEEPEQPNQGWGPRIVLMEKKIAELEAAISTADKAITKKIVDTQAGANDAMGRIDSIERTCHNEFTTLRLGK